MTELAAGAKVTWVTRPWLAVRPDPTVGGGQARFVHAPSFYVPDLDVPFALCNNAVFLADAREDLPRCPKCVRFLADRHDLWPV